MLFICAREDVADDDVVTKRIPSWMMMTILNCSLLKMTTKRRWKKMRRS